MGQEHPLMMVNGLQLAAWRISGKITELQCFHSKLPKLWRNLEDREFGNLTDTPGKSGMAGASFGRRVLFKPLLSF